MTSKYDDFWRQRLHDVEGLLREAYDSRASKDFDASAIRSLGERGSWYGLVEIERGTCTRAETAQMRSLANVLADGHVLDKYAGARFKLVLSTTLKLRAIRLDGGRHPTGVPPRPVGEAFQPAATLSEVAPQTRPCAPEMQRRHLADILADLPFKSWQLVARNTPVWRFAQPFLQPYGYGPFAVLLVTAGINDYQLKGKAELIYWRKLSARLQESATPLSCVDLETMLKPFYARERLGPAKLRRLGQFLSSPLAAQLWGSSPSRVSADLHQIWQQLAQTMHQRPERKTICLAMKFLACSLWMADETGFDFGSIPIPVDSRVLAFARRAGICQLYTEAQIRRACGEVLLLLRKREQRVTMIHLDSLLWQIAGLTNDELKGYFLGLHASVVGQNLVAFLSPHVSGAVQTSRGGSRL